MKIAIPVDDNLGLNSKVSYHFGHARFLALYDTEKKSLEFHTVVEGEGCSPVMLAKTLGANVIYCFGMGMKAMMLCKELGISVKTGDFETIGEILENLENLKDLDKTCGH